MIRILVLASILMAAGAARAEDGTSVAWPTADGRAKIAQSFHGSDIAIGSSTRTAGAIDSLTWGGRQFINAFDHGRELQSAASFDEYGECLNPTEAGSANDGIQGRSTSLLTEIEVGSAQLRTRSRMAFWLQPGQTSPGCPKGPGPYDAARSDFGLAKHVAIGVHGVLNAIAYEATFSIPRRYASAVYEAATAYMPPDFSRFWTLDPASGRLAPLSDGPGEQGLPVVLATEDGTHALAVYSPALPQASMPGVGYGRFRFAELPGPGNATVKWNCVFRETDLAAGDRTFTCYVLVGTLADVQDGLRALHAALSGQARLGPEGAPARPPPAIRGTALYVGTQPNCNAGIVTVDPAFRGCGTAPIGSTAAAPASPADAPVYVGTAAGVNAGTVTSNPHHLNAQTRPIGFLPPPDAGGTAIYVGTQAGCNAGVASTNPAHLDCSAVRLGTTLR